MEDFTNEVLNEVEKEKAMTFASDKIALESVKKFILAVAYKHGVIKKGEAHKANINWALQMAWGATNNGVPRSDEELGQNLRALAYAVQIVESGFKELQELKQVETLQENKENPAE